MIRAAAVLAVTLMSGTALGETITVRSGQSIQQAVNLANSGDTIVVEEGTYAPVNITKNGVTLRSETPGGAHIIATGNDQAAVSSYGQDGVSIIGFRLTSRNGDGVKIGGSPGNPAKNLRVEGNIIENAALDGMKVFQAQGLSMNNNTIVAAGTSGKAGSSGNRNGDGGIDWVQVERSEMVGNTVSTNGWACVMVKNGSNNNRIANNKLNRCEVNGLDMAAGSSGDAADANTSGKVAFNNVIEGNTISGGSGCGAKFADNSTNNKLAGNNRISGAVCDPNGSNTKGANVQLAAVGSEGGYSSPEALQFEDTIIRTVRQGHSAEAIRDGFEVNGWLISEATIEAIASGQMSAQEALDRGYIVPAADQTTTQGPTQYTGTANYGGGDSYSGGSFSIEDAPGMACGGGQVASTAMGVAGSIAAIWSGGRATAPLQIAQQIQLYTANACLFSQLQSQLRSLWTQMQNLKNTDLATINGTLSALYRIRSMTGQTQSASYQVNRIGRMMRDNYPDSYANKTNEEVMAQHIIWEEASKSATEESWRIQSQIMQNQAEMEQRTSNQVAALNRAPGALAAQQATGNLITTLIEKAANMETASIAHYRVMEHQMMVEQAEKQNDAELHKRRMEGWGYSDSAANDVFGR